MAQKKAIFVTEWLPEGRPNVPPNEQPMDNPEALYLGTSDGCGFSVLSHVPTENTCIVEVCAEEENMELMKADVTYLWLEDIEIPSMDFPSQAEQTTEEGDIIDV